MSRRAGMGCSTISKPPTVTLPSVGGIKPVIMRMVVDLPAPLGPRKPSTSPRSTENETPSTARLGPNVLTKFSTFIMLNTLLNHNDQFDIAVFKLFVKCFFATKWLTSNPQATLRVAKDRTNGQKKCSKKV